MPMGARTSTGGALGERLVLDEQHLRCSSVMDLLIVAPLISIGPAAYPGQIF
jgi:hypothetical protein